MPPSDTPALVLLSGGIDSSTLLHHVSRDLAYSPMRALSFQYGQRHARELACAQWQATAAGVEDYRLIDIAFMGNLLLKGSALIDGGDDVPDLAALDEEALTQPPTYVPNRNMMLLSMAVACAEAAGIHDVFYGAQEQDEYGYWDCTSDFIDRMNRVLALNRATPVTIHAPFVSMKKAQILEIGQRLGIDYAHTWSCYRGETQPCGTCPTCVERATAFEAMGESDPLVRKT